MKYWPDVVKCLGEHHNTRTVLLPDHAPEIIEITSERQLAERFGEPNDSNYEYWFAAAQFLSYGGLLKTIRVNASQLKNAVDTGTAPLIKNLQDYETSIETAANNFTLEQLLQL